MIKRLAPYLVACCLLALLPSLGKAQCTPDPNASGLYSPDENEGLPGGFIEQQYEATITINVPNDTVLGSFTLTLDSVLLTDVSGLPPEFTYECFPASCSFPSGEQSCILLTGLTNDPAHATDWDISTTFVFYGKQGPLPLSIPYTDNLYTLSLAPAVVSAYTRPDEQLRFTIGPNPVNKLSRLTYDLPQAGRVSISVYNLVGSTVYSFENEGSVGENSLRMSAFELQPGIYFIELSQGSYKRSTRFVIQE